MNVSVRFFASLREQVGHSCIDMRVTGRSDITGLLASLREKFGERVFVVLSAPNVRVALNEEFVELDSVIHEGDVVAFMPPITGG